MHALALLLMTACPPVEPPAPPAALEAPAPAAPPAADDLNQVLALALACTPEAPEGPPNAALAPAGEGSWRVTLRISGTETRDHVIDPQAKTCDGEPLTADFEPARSLTELVELCWAEAEREGGVGVSGTPLLREKVHVSAYEGRVTLSFEEAAPNTMPRGLDLAVDMDRGRCARTIMD